jgi:hypothetical protein
LADFGLAESLARFKAGNKITTYEKKKKTESFLWFFLESCIGTRHLIAPVRAASDRRRFFLEPPRSLRVKSSLFLFVSLRLSRALCILCLYLYLDLFVLLTCPILSLAIDIWAAGVLMLVFATRRYPFWVAHDPGHALSEICDVVGTQALINAAAQFQNCRLICDKREPVPLKQFCSKYEKREKRVLEDRRPLYSSPLFCFSLSFS